MNGILIHPAGSSPALGYACEYLRDRGFQLLNKPAKDVTHLLLPVPSFEGDNRIRGGGILEHILSDLPHNVTVVGGNLEHPALSGYQKIDLLKDAQYLAQNAALTAHCAIPLAAKALSVAISDCRCLILGWGRIGKCLAFLLKGLGAKVTVAARKEADRATVSSLGFEAVDTAQCHKRLENYKLLINTIPHPMLTKQQLEHCPQGCVKLDLASCQGIAGEDVLWARGLPGKDVPESSGILIAQSLLRILYQGGWKG